MAWDIGYNPNVNKMLHDLEVDSISIVEFFDVLIGLRNACLLSYNREYNCVRITHYDPNTPNMNSPQMMDDLLEFYEAEQWVSENK